MSDETHIESIYQPGEAPGECFYEMDREALKRQVIALQSRLQACVEQRDNAMNELFALKLRLADIQAAWTTMTKNSVRVEVQKP